LHWSLRLSEAVDDADTRSAELRMAVRACRRLGADLTNTLLSAEGRVREPWYALELEAVALRSSDRMRLFDAMYALSELAPIATKPGALERAAYALRAAEVLEGSAPSEVQSAVMRLLSRVHEHPMAVEQLAHLHMAAEDPTAAAYSFERAARSSASAHRRAELHYTAGVMFQDRLKDPQRAIENLAQTAREDLMYEDTFARLRSLYAQSERPRELLALLDTRLGLEADAELTRELHWQRQALCMELGELTEAETSLLAVLKLQPDDRDALSALAQVFAELGNYAGATETLQHLMQQLEAPSDLAQVLLRLAGLYERELRDPERAQSALERAHELAPEDPGVLKQLSVLHARQGRSEDALRLAAKAVETAATPELRDQAVVRQANLLELLGQRMTAQETLLQARKKSPASLALVRAQTSLLERLGDTAALAEHLSGSCEALRDAIVEDPGEAPLWLGLCEVLYARGRGDAARLIGHTAKAFGIEHPDLPDDAVPGLGTRVLHQIGRAHV
jgi:tetratricopeptide (TPR) repeat protein